MAYPILSLHKNPIKITFNTDMHDARTSTTVVHSAHTIKTRSNVHFMPNKTL